MMPGAAHIYLHAQSFQAPALVGGSFVLSLREGAKTHRAHSQRKLEQTLTMRKRTIGSRLSPGMASGDVERELTAANYSRMLAAPRIGPGNPSLSDCTRITAPSLPLLLSDESGSFSVVPSPPSQAPSICWPVTIWV